MTPSEHFIDWYRTMNEPEKEYWEDPKFWIREAAKMVAIFAGLYILAVLLFVY